MSERGAHCSAPAHLASLPGEAGAIRVEPAACVRLRRAVAGHTPAVGVEDAAGLGLRASARTAAMGIDPAPLVRLGRARPGRTAAVGIDDAPLFLPAPQCEVLAFTLALAGPAFPWAAGLLDDALSWQTGAKAGGHWDPNG